MSDWERWGGVECVACPECAFTFDASHTDSDGNYSCPSCAEMRLRDALAEDREKWSFDTLLFVADRILDRDYAVSVFPRSDSDEGDPGPVFLRRLRDARDRCREALRESA